MIIACDARMVRLENFEPDNLSELVLKGDYECTSLLPEGPSSHMEN